MKKLLAAVLGGTAVASLAFASASMLDVDGGVIQAGSGTVTCDTDGVKANWALETGTNTVNSVRISGIAAACVGAEIFVKTDDMAQHVKAVITASADSAATNAKDVSLTLPAGTTPESIESIQIWIEG